MIQLPPDFGSSELARLEGFLEELPEGFRYAVERNCDPNTAGQYQSILFEIVGCQAFAETDPSDQAAYDAAKAALGVAAPDDKTLVIDLAVPAPFYATVASLWVFFPAQQELIEQGGEDWWKDPALQIGNGPPRTYAPR